MPSLTFPDQIFQNNFTCPCNPHTPPPHGGADPAARDLGNYCGTGEIVPFVNRTFEWAVVIATFLSVLSIVPHYCARLTYFFHPKLREINAVLITLKLITFALRRAVTAPHIGLQPLPKPLQRLLNVPPLLPPLLPLQSLFKAPCCHVNNNNTQSCA